MLIGESKLAPFRVLPAQALSRHHCKNGLQDLPHPKMLFSSDHKLNGSPITMFPHRTELSAFVDINRHGLHPDRKISETAMEHRMFAHAEKLEASGGEAIPERNEGYIIWQDEHLIEKAQTYDEATRKGKVVKRRHPEAKVEIQYSGVTVELK